MIVENFRKKIVIPGKNNSRKKINSVENPWYILDTVMRNDPCWNCRCRSSESDRRFARDAGHLPDPDRPRPVGAAVLRIGAGADEDLREAGPRSAPPATGVGCRGRESGGHHSDVPVTGRPPAAELRRLLVGEAAAHGTTRKVSTPRENKLNRLILETRGRINSRSDKQSRSACNVHLHNHLWRVLEIRLFFFPFFSTIFSMS